MPDRLVELRRLADEGRPGAVEALADLEKYREVLAQTTAPNRQQPGNARRNVAAVATAYRVVHDRLTALASALDLPHLAPPGPPAVSVDDSVVPVHAVPVPAFPVQLVPPGSKAAKEASGSKTAPGSPKPPAIADLVADPATRAWLTSNTIPPHQVARLVTGGRLRFDPGQVDQVVRMLGGEGDARELVALTEVLGAVPLDLRERSEAAGLAGPGPLFGVVRELAVSPADVAALGDVLARVADGSSKFEPDKGSWVDRLRTALADAGVRTDSDLVWLMRLTRRMDLAPADRRWLGELRDLGVPLELLHELPDEYVRAALDGRRRADTGLPALAADAGFAGPAALEAAAERLGVPPVDLALALGDRLRTAVSDAPPLSDAGPDGLREQGQRVADRLLAQVASTGPGLDRWVRWSARLGFPVDRLRPLAEIPMLEGLIWEALGDVHGGRVAEVLVPLVPEAAAPAPIAARHIAVPTPEELAAWSQRLGVPDYYLRRVLVMPGVDGRALPAMADRLALPPEQAAALVRLVEVTGRVSADDLLMFAYRLGTPAGPYLLVWLASYWEIHPRRLMPLRPLFARIAELPTRSRPSMQEIEELVGRWADPGRAGAGYHAEPAADLTDGLLLDRHDTFDDDQFRMWPTAEETAASVRAPQPAPQRDSGRDDDSDRSSASESHRSHSLLSIPDDDEQQAQHTSLAALVYSGRSTWTRADGAGRSRRNASALFWAAGLGSGPEGAGLEVLDGLRTFVPTAVRDRRDRLRRWAEISSVEAEELWQDTEKVAADPDLGTLTRQAAIVASAATAAVPALTRDITSPDVTEVVRGAVQAADAVVDAVRAWTDRHADRPIPSAGDDPARPVRVPDLLRSLPAGERLASAQAGRDDLAAMLTGVRTLLHTLTRTTEAGSVYRTAAMVIEAAATHIARLVVGAGTPARPGTALIANAVAAQAIEAAQRLTATVAAWDRLAGGLSAAELAAAVTDGQAEARNRRETDDQSADVILAPSWAKLIDVPESEIEEDRYLRPWLDHLAIVATAGRLKVPPGVVYEYARRNGYHSERASGLRATWSLGPPHEDLYRLANDLSVPVRLLSPLRALLSARAGTAPDLEQVRDSLLRVQLPDRIAKWPRRRLAFLADVGLRTTQATRPGELEDWPHRWVADILGLDPEDLDGADGVSLRSLLELVDLVRREYAVREPDGNWARHDLESLADALGLSSYLVTGHSVRMGRVPMELADKMYGAYLFLLATALRMDSREVTKQFGTVLTEVMDRALPRQVVVERALARIRAKGKAPAPRESLTGKLLRIGVASNDRVPRHLGLLAQQAGVSATELVETAYQAGEVDLWLTADAIGLAVGSRPVPQGGPEAEAPVHTVDPAALPRMVNEWVDWLGGIAWTSTRLHPPLTAQARRVGWTFDELSALPGDERKKVLAALAASASEAGLNRVYHNTVFWYGRNVEKLLPVLTTFVADVAGARLELPMPRWAEPDSRFRVNVHVPHSVDADFATFAAVETRREWILTNDPATWEEMERGLRELRQDGTRVAAATVSLAASPDPATRIAELDLTPLTVSALIAVIALPGGLTMHPELLGYLGYEVDPYDSTRLDRRVSRPERLRVDPFLPIEHPPARAAVMAAAIVRQRKPAPLVVADRPSTTTTWFLDDGDPARVGADEHHLVPHDVGDAPGSLVRAVLDGARAQGLRLPSQVRDEDGLIRHARQAVQDDPTRFPLRTIGDLVAGDLDDQALLGLAQALPIRVESLDDLATLRWTIMTMISEGNPRLRRLLGTAVASPSRGAAWTLSRVGAGGATAASHVAHLLPDAIGDPTLWDSALVDEILGVLAVVLEVDLVVVETEAARRFSGGGGSTLHLLRGERGRFQSYRPAPVPAQLTAIEPAQVIFGEYDPATDVTRLPLVVTGMDGRRLRDLTADLTGQELIDQWAVHPGRGPQTLVLVMGGAADESGPYGALARRFRDRFATPVIASTVDIVLGADGKVSAASVVRAPDGTVDHTRTEPGEFRYFPPAGGGSESVGNDLAAGAEPLGLPIVVNLPIPDTGATVLAARPARPAVEEAPVPRLFVDGDGTARIGSAAAPPPGWLSLGDATPYLALRWLLDGGPDEGLDLGALGQEELEFAAAQAIKLRGGRMVPVDLTELVLAAFAEAPEGAARVQDWPTDLWPSDSILFLSPTGTARAAVVQPNGELLAYRPVHGGVGVTRLSQRQFVEETGPGWYVVREGLRGVQQPVLPSPESVDPRESRRYDRPAGVLPHLVQSIEQIPAVDEMTVVDEMTDVDGLEVRLNPLWMPLAEFTPQVWGRRPGHTWMFVVLERRAHTGSEQEDPEAGTHPDDLLVFVGSEAASAAMSSWQFDELLATLRRTDPEATPGHVRDLVDGPGHPSLAVRFSTDPATRDAALVAPAGVAGELRWNPGTDIWYMNDKSGRFNDTEERHQHSPRSMHDWLIVAARLVADQVRAPVLPLSVRIGSGTGRPGARHDIPAGVHFVHPADNEDTFAAVRRMPRYSTYTSVFATLEPATGEVVTREGRYGPQTFVQQLHRAGLDEEVSLLLVFFLPGGAEGSATDRQALMRFAQAVHRHGNFEDVVVNDGPARILPGDTDVRLGTLTVDVHGGPLIQEEGQFVKLTLFGEQRRLGSSADAAMTWHLHQRREASDAEVAPQRYPVPFGAPRVEAPPGTAYDGGVLVVGDLTRWREWPFAERVAEAAASWARPVVVVGPEPEPKHAALTALGATLTLFGARRQLPLVLAATHSAELTALVRRHGLPVIGADEAGPAAPWRVIGPDGRVHWSTTGFTPALFVAAREVTPAEAASVDRVRLSEMTRALIDRAKALTDLTADRTAVEEGRNRDELEPTAAAARIADLSDEILSVQTEIHRLRERKAELTEIARHQPVEATPEGLTSHIRVEQSVPGADRWLLVPVLIDDTGVHGRHPETGERTADYFLTASRQWLPRLRGGAPGAIRDASVEAPTASRTDTAPAGTSASPAAAGVVPPRGAAGAASPSPSDLPGALATTEAQVRFVAWAVPDRLAALRRLAAEGHPGAGAASAAVDAHRRVLFGAAHGPAPQVSEADRTTSYQRMHERLVALDLPYLAPPTTDPSGGDDAVASLPVVPETDFPVVLVAPGADAGPDGRTTDTDDARWLQGVGITGPQAARLLDDGELPFDRTEVDRLAQRLAMAGDEVAELVNLVEVLGTVPLDVGTHAREIGLAGPGPLFGVVRDLGVLPELVVTVGDVLARVVAGSREIEPDEGSWVDLLRTELAGEGVRTDSDLVWLMRLVRRSKLSPADRSALGELRELGVPLELLHELPTVHVRAALTRRSRAAGSLATLATESGLAGPAALEAAAERFGVPPVDLALALGDQLRAAAASVPVTSPDDPEELRRQGQRVAEAVSALLPADADVVRWVRWTARLGFPVEHLRPLVDSPTIAESVWAVLGDVPSERVADALVPVAPEPATTAELTRALARKRDVPASAPTDLAQWAEQLGVRVAYLRRVTALPGVDGARLSELADRLGLSATQAPALVRLVEVTGRVPVELPWIAYRLGLMRLPYVVVWLAATWETDPRGLLSLRPLFDRIREMPPEVRPSPGQIEELVTRWAALGRPAPRGDGGGDAQEWPVRSDASIISESAPDDQRSRYVRELLRFAEVGAGPQGGGLHLADRLRAVHVAELTRNVEQLRRSRDVAVADPSAVWQEVDAVADDPFVGALTRQAAIIVGTARSVTLTLHHPVADPGDVIQAATRAAGALTAAVRWWTEHHADRSIPGVDETTTPAGLAELAAALPGPKPGGRRDAAGQMLAEMHTRLEPLSRPSSTWHIHRNADLVIRTAAVHVTRLLVAAGAAASPSASLITAAVADQVVEAARQLATAMRTWDRLTGGMSAAEVSATAEAPPGADDLPPAQFVDNLLAASWATLFAVHQHDIEGDRRERSWLDPEMVYSLAVEEQVPSGLVYRQARAQEHLSERTPDRLRAWGVQPPYEAVYQSALDLQVPVRLLQPFLRAGGVAAHSDAAWIRGVLSDMAQRAGTVIEEPSRHLAFMTDLGFDANQPVTGRELDSADRQWTADVLGMDPSDLDGIGTARFDDLARVVEKIREYHDGRTPGGSWGRHEIESLADALDLSYLLVLGHSVRVGRVPVELSDDPYGSWVFLLANRGRVDARDLAPIRGEIAVHVDRGGPRHVVLNELAALLREHVGGVPPRDSLTRRLLGVSDAEELKLLHLREQYQLVGTPIEDALTVAELAEVTLDVALEFITMAAGHLQSGADGAAARGTAELPSAPETPEVTATRLREWVARLDGIQDFDGDVAEVLWGARDAGWTLEDLSALSVDDAERVLEALWMAPRLDVEFRSITVGYGRDVEAMFSRLKELVEYAADSRFDQRNLMWTDVALTGVRIDVDLPGATGAEPESRGWDLEREPDRRSVNAELSRLHGAGTTMVSVAFQNPAGDVVRVAEVDTAGPVFGALAAIHGLPGGLARHPDLLAHLGYEFAPYDRSRLDRRVSAVPPLPLASFARVADPSLRAVIMMAVIWRERQSASLVPASRVEPLTTRLLADGEPTVVDEWEYHLGARDLGTEPGSLTRAVLDSARAQGLELPAHVRDEATLLQHAGQVVRADPHRFTIRSIGELIIGSLADEAVALLAGALGLNEPSLGEPSLRTRLVAMADEDTARLYRFLTLLTPDSDAAGALVRAGSPGANPARDAAALLVAAIGAPRMWNSAILDEVVAVFAVALGVDLVVLGDEDARTYPGGGPTLFVRRVGGDVFQSYRPTGSWGQPAAFGSSPALLAEHDPTTDVARVPVVLDGRRHRDVTARFTGDDLIDRWVSQAADTSAPLVLLVGGAARGDGTHGLLAARFRDRLLKPVIAPLDDIALDPQGRVSAVRADRRTDGTVDLHEAQPSEFWYFPATGGTAVPLGADLVSGAATVGLRLVADLPPSGGGRTALALRPVPPPGDDLPPPSLFVDGDGAVRLGRFASPPEGWWPLGDASPLLALRWLMAGGPVDGIDPSALGQPDLQVAAEHATQLHEHQMVMMDVPYRLRSLLAADSPRATTVDDRLRALQRGDGVIFVGVSGQAQAATRLRNGDLLVYRPARGDTSTERLSWARFVEEAGDGWFLVQHRAADPAPVVLPTDGPVDPTASRWYDRPENVGAGVVPEIEQAPQSSVVRGEKTDGLDVRLNPLWMPLADFTPEVWAGRPDHDWLFLVLERGSYAEAQEGEDARDLLVFVGSETATDAMSPAQLDDLLTSMRKVDPTVTLADVRDMLDGPGHPSLAARFEGDGTARLTRAGVAGNLRRDPQTGTWALDGLSGRYSSGRLGPLDHLDRWLRDVARLIADQVREPVRSSVYSSRGRIESRYEFDSKIYYPHPADTLDTYHAVRRMPDFRPGVWSVYATLDPQTGEVVTRNGRYGPRNFTRELARSNARYEGALLLVLFLPGDAEGTEAELKALSRFGERVQEARRTDVTVSVGTAHILPGDGDVRLGTLTADVVGAPMVEPAGAFVRFRQPEPGRESEPKPPPELLDASADASMMALLVIGYPSGVHDAPQRHPVPFGPPRIDAPRGAAYDGGLLVVGDVDRWRQRSVAEAVARAARTVRRPVVVVEVGARVDERSAVLTLLGMTLIKLGERQLQPIVVATAPAAALTALVNRYDLALISPESTAADAGWQVTGPDGAQRWSTSAFVPTLLTTAGQITTGPVARSGSVILSKWLGQPDWPTAEEYLRENVADLRHPYVADELAHLQARDPDNRLLSAHKAVLELVEAANGAIDPAGSRYQPTEPIQATVMEPRTSVQGPMTVTFALDYLEPKPDALSRKPWDDRLLRLMYTDDRARALAAALAAGVVGEQPDRVDDGRWNATVFGAVAIVLRMTREEAHPTSSVEAWDKALEDVACCEANPYHRWYWVDRLDELRDEVRAHGIPGHVDGPAPHHADLLGVLTETAASCAPGRQAPGRVP
ncbi:hypothetical protein [Verrucosispora sp. SN26_14.1]|uniref:hypothetical protein n=1 Tax=Verrucosispora sp. SN26_14.1 TaxID=2527879 RepID=UPI001F180FB5|nr:hypothetical protein [Verrucosispora sp. SN26_14.1]